MIYPPSKQSSLPCREVVTVENIRLIRLLDLTADFGVKTNATLTPREEQNCYSNCLYTVTKFLRKFSDVYSQIFNFSAPPFDYTIFLLLLLLPVS